MYSTVYLIIYCITACDIHHVSNVKIYVEINQNFPFKDQKLRHLPLSANQCWFRLAIKSFFDISKSGCQKSDQPKLNFTHLVWLSGRGSWTSEQKTRFVISRDFNGGSKPKSLITELHASFRASTFQPCKATTKCRWKLTPVKFCFSNVTSKKTRVMRLFLSENWVKNVCFLWLPFWETCKAAR